MTFLLVLISGLRNKAVGSDTYRYILSLEAVKNLQWKDIFSNFFDSFFNATQTYKDPGYLVVEKIISYFTTSQIPFLLIVAILTLVPLAKFIHHFSFSSSEMMMSFVFFIPLIFPNIPNQIVRMSIAFGLVCWSYILMSNNNNWKFLLLVLIASTIHKSALLVLLFWVCQKYISPKIIFYGTPILFLAVLLYPEVFVMLLDGSAGAYEVYLHLDQTGTESRPFVILIVMCFIYFIILLGLKSGEIDWKENKLLIIGSAFAIGLSPVVRIDPVMFRLVSYFAPWAMLLLPKSIEGQHLMNKRLLYIIVCAMFIVKAYGAQYKFFWQDMQLNDTYITMCESPSIHSEMLNIYDA